MKMHATRMAPCVGSEDETQVAKLVQPVLLLTQILSCMLRQEFCLATENEPVHE